MLALTRYADNPFLDKEISQDELVAFTADCLPRLSADNPGGVYTAAVASLSALFDTLGGRITDETAVAGIRRARTQAATARRQALQKALSSLEALAHSRLSRGSAEYGEVFPDGLKEFDAATLDQLNGRVEALLERAATAAARLGQADLDAVEAARVAFATVRGEQLQKKAGFGAAAEGRRAADAALRDQLFHALLLVVDQHRGDPAAVSRYFTQSLLENPQRQPASATTTPPQPGAGGSV